MDQISKTRVGLAPMEGVSDLPFRLWMSAVSAPIFSCTPFLRVTNTYPKDSIPPEFAPELKCRGAVNYELIPQIMATSAGDFIRIARHFLEFTDFVDLNCGCPSPNAVGGGAGSSMLKSPENLRLFLTECLNELGPERVSVKIRTGFDSHSELEQILSALHDLPLKRLTIHGRTRAQRYDGLSRWQMIGKAALDFPQIPVTVSGDVLSIASLVDKSDYLPLFDQVIVGRGALRNPWIFKEIREQKSVTLPLKTILESLACLGILYEAKAHRPNELLDLLEAGTFNKPFQSEIEKWQWLFYILSSRFKNKDSDFTTIEMDRFALGRVKMIWNYVRSSLPTVFFAPTILRANTFPSFITRILESASDLEQMIPIQHHAELDWVYTSNKKPPEATDHLFS